VPVRMAAKRLGVTPHQVVLAWLLAVSPQVLPIPGTGSPDHATENIAAASIELTPDEIDAISKGGLPFRSPPAMYRKFRRRVGGVLRYLHVR